MMIIDSVSRALESSETVILADMMGDEFVETCQANPVETLTEIIYPINWPRQIQ